MKKVFLTILFSLFVIGHAYAASITVNTLYPAPVGEWDKVKVGLIEFTGTYGKDSACTGSSLAVQGELLLTCQAGVLDIAHGIWTQTNDNIFLTDTTNPLLKKVGIGTSSPEFKLDIDQDGGIIARGTFGSGATLTTSGNGTRFIWYPRKAALRAGNIAGSGPSSGAEWNNANIGDYSVAFGADTEASGDLSAVGGGWGNQATGWKSTIGGGRANKATGDSDTVGGGDSNTAGSTFFFGVATVGGGAANQALADAATISGGIQNTIPDLLPNPTPVGATIGGGEENTASGAYATISGGGGNLVGNTASGTQSSIGGGYSNTASGLTSVISGGRGNTASGESATISGGIISTASGLRSTIGGGQANQATDEFAVIAGGNTNKATGKHTFVGGGQANEADSDWSTVGGGANNNTGGVSGTNSTVGGGNSNLASGATATVAGGQQNDATGTLSSIVGGAGSTASGDNSFVGGGQGNSADGQFATVSGGVNNDADGTSATIAGGSTNHAHGDNSFVAGQGMQLTSTADGTFVYGTNGPLSITQANAAIFWNVDVGIGTTTPTQKLHINDVMRIEPRANAPACNENGMLYVDDSGALCYCDGTNWNFAAQQAGANCT